MNECMIYGFSWLLDSGSYQGSLQDSGDLLQGQETFELGFGLLFQ